MTITIEKKHLFYLFGVILIGLVVFIITRLSFKKVDYEATAKDAKINAYAVVALSSDILSEYHKVWQGAIEGSVSVKDEYGKEHNCSDFSEAISYKMRRYKFEGYFDIIDSLSNVVKEDLRTMDDAPKKYEETQKTFLAMFGDMNSLVSLAKEPKGSLLTFASKVNELTMSFDKNFQETDLKVNVPEEELKQLVASIYETFAKKKAEKWDALYGSYKKAGEDFLAKNAKKEGVVTLPSGVQYKVLKVGKGAIPKDTSRVKVHYEGRTLDGNVFDSSYRRGQPTDFRANQVIPGWTEVLIHMPEGSIWEVYIPQELAYGERQQGSDIKPYSMLIFKMELVKVYK
ncbi:Domain amino terminal to FKBP-type peptidyl-prolyl isomerase [Prevotellaceae bacterium HUN156]|nr:Domain amino terminal to FKBP-type peptidyl-prolyl isomerase [Prevotellaceae bacterium HUN156]